MELGISLYPEFMDADPLHIYVHAGGVFGVQAGIYVADPESPEFFRCRAAGFAAL